MHGTELKKSNTNEFIAIKSKFPHRTSRVVVYRQDGDEITEQVVHTGSAVCNIQMDDHCVAILHRDDKLCFLRKDKVYGNDESTPVFVQLSPQDMRCIRSPCLR